MVENRPSNLAPLEANYPLAYGRFSTYYHSMRIHLEDDEHIALTLLEIHILIALAISRNTSRGIGHTISERTGLSATISQGSLIPALQRLERATLIYDIHVIPKTGRPYRLYHLAAAGELVLKWRLTELQNLSSHGLRHLATRGL
jgi:DNA-binding PadR family transcriptional regulator